jgi:ribose transport system substrate-binding protein
MRGGAAMRGGGGLQRRDLLAAGVGMIAGGALAQFRRQPNRSSDATTSGQVMPESRDAEYVWLSCNRDLALFVAHDHVALEQAGRDLGVRVTKQGPDKVDIPGLVSAIEQTTARRPAGMMIVGWDANALIPCINSAMEQGIPVVCVDADVPGSKRASFIGTDWRDLGKQQAIAMLKALSGRRGTVAMLGLIDQSIDVEAFDGFRSIAQPAGLTVMEPRHDQGSQAEATRVAAGLIQSQADLVGLAGFDSESGPGIGQAIKEAGKGDTLVATCVEAEAQHLRLLKEGVLTACIGQKRELFTYQGVVALHALAFPRISFTKDDRSAGVFPIPERYYTGTYTVTRENVDLFLNTAS